MSKTFQEPQVTALKRLPQEAAARADTPGQTDPHMDTWTVGLLADIVVVDPEYAWMLLGLVLDIAPDTNLAKIGAGELEDFCRAAAAADIDRSEARSPISEGPRSKQNRTGDL